MNAEHTEITYAALPTLDDGQIWGTRDQGVFVVVSQRPARWQGEDIDVYAHVETWYTIRPATEAERMLWNAAVGAATARRELRKQLGAGGSYRLGVVSRQLVSTLERLDSYDDRWNPPPAIDLDDSAYAIEQNYLEALSRLNGHQEAM